jgi:hypothetical protein
VGGSVIFGLFRAEQNMGSMQRLKPQEHDFQPGIT